MIAARRLTAMTWWWGVAAALALLWPDHVSGPFDGVPLDRLPEALVIGAAFPILWVLAPTFLRTRLAHVLILLLLAWRLASVGLLAQDGWCLRFEPTRPFAKDAHGAPHAWDLRADWRAPTPRCSAIMTRSYDDLHQFPAWFFNLPPADDGWPGPLDRPPGATVLMTVAGFLRNAEPGRLDITQDPTAVTQASIDGRPSSLDASLAPGTHLIAVRTTLTGDQWRLATHWNGRDLWPLRIATVTRSGAGDVFVRRWMWWVPPTLVSVLMVAWLATALLAVRDPALWAWTIGASIVLALLVAIDRADLARYAVLGLAAAAWVPVRATSQNTRGAFMMIGVPWMAFAVACAATAVGRWVLYGSGHDTWMYQRFAYRIVLQGYWLEGGSPTFWFQPLYRWIAGLLHVVFGDSSAGEWYWDAACLLAGGLFVYRVVRPIGGFRWAVAAAVIPLATFTFGTAQYLIGFGLSEISSTGFIYVAALWAMRARGGSWRAALAAGLFATLAFYTRLNNLVMAFGVALFAIPTGSLRRTGIREAAIIVATIACGVLFLAGRSWHYTGVFSPFYGTQRSLLATWQPGMALGTAWKRMADSVLMVLTVNDPPRFDVFALPVLTGAAVALLAAARASRLRAVPLSLVLFFAASIAGAFVARGSAYPGRFSVHVLPVTAALTMCGAYALAGYRGETQPRIL